MSSPLLFKPTSPAAPQVPSWCRMSLFCHPCRQKAGPLGQSTLQCGPRIALGQVSYLH